MGANVLTPGEKLAIGIKLFLVKERMMRAMRLCVPYIQEASLSFEALGKNAQVLSESINKFSVAWRNHE